MAKIMLTVTVTMDNDNAAQYRAARATPDGVTLAEDVRSFVEYRVGSGLDMLTDATVEVKPAW